MRNKSTDLEKLAAKLDISPSMHKYAVDRYKGIADYLKEQGIKADFYPQGSFRTGTVIRPLKDGKDADFDIDVVCELLVDSESITPKDVKLSVGEALQSNKVYSDKMRPEDERCWTLEYADLSDGVGLIMDVVPCAHENNRKILLLKSLHVPQEFAEQAVAITEKQDDGNYQWQASNPGGYGDWFDNINRPFLERNLKNRKQQFLNENRALFDYAASVEDVPDYYIHSPLQRAIQLLKRHRDIFYSRSDQTNSLRPASVIITTLAAQIAQHASVIELEDLLPYIVNGFADYSALLQGRRPFNEAYGESKAYIERQNQRWQILNPVNPKDNYADSWTDDTAKMFFKWVAAAKTDLGDPTPVLERKYLAGLQRGLGTSYVNETLKPYTPSGSSVISSHSEPQPLSHPTKPWGRG